MCIVGIHPDTSDVFTHKTDHLVTGIFQIFLNINNKKYHHMYRTAISQAVAFMYNLGPSAIAD